jgi:hypothetical protein
VPWDEEVGAIPRGQAGAREDKETGVTVLKEGQTVPLAGTARSRILDTRTGSTSVSTVWTSVSRAWSSA